MEHDGETAHHDVPHSISVESSEKVFEESHAYASTLGAQLEHTSAEIGPLREELSIKDTLTACLRRV